MKTDLIDSLEIVLDILEENIPREKIDFLLASYLSFMYNLENIKIVNLVDRISYGDREAIKNLQVLSRKLRHSLKNGENIEELFEIEKNFEEFKIYLKEVGNIIKEKFLRSRKEYEGIIKKTDIYITLPLFGRKEEISKILSQMDKKDIIIIHGDSGCGKTRFLLEIAKILEKRKMKVAFLSKKISESILEFINDVNVLIIDDAHIYTPDFLLKLPEIIAKDKKNEKNGKFKKVILSCKSNFLEVILKLVKRFGDNKIEELELKPLKSKYVELIIEKISEISGRKLKKDFIENISTISGGNPKYAVIFSEYSAKKRNLPRTSDEKELLSLIYDENIKKLPEEALNLLADICLLYVINKKDERKLIEKYQKYDKFIEILMKNRLILKDNDIIIPSSNFLASYIVCKRFNKKSHFDSLKEYFKEKPIDIVYSSVLAYEFDDEKSFFLKNVVKSLNMLENCLDIFYTIVILSFGSGNFEILKNLRVEILYDTFEELKKLKTGDKNYLDYLAEYLNPILVLISLAFFKAKRYNDTIFWCSKSLEIDPNFVDAYIIRANAYEKLKKYENAISDYTAVLKIKQDYLDAYYNRGLIYGKLKMYKEAIEDFTKFIENSPRNSDAYIFRGKAFAKIGNYQKAIEDFTKAIEINERNYEAYLSRADVFVKMGMYREAIDDCTKVLNINPTIEKALLKRGKIYLMIGEYKKAIEDFTKAIEINPNMTFAYYYRGKIYESLGEYEKALEDYTSIIDINPNFRNIFLIRGKLLFKIGKYEEAIEDLKKASSANKKENKGIIKMLGIAHLNIGDYREAIKYFTEILKMDPENAEAYYNRGTAYVELKHKMLAIRDFTKAIKINPKYTEAYIARGRVFLEMKNYKKAFKDFQKAVEIDSNCAEGYYYIGKIYESLRKYDEALKFFTKAIEADKNYADAYVERGKVYFKLGLYRKALKDLSTAIKIDENNADAYYNRGVVLTMLRKFGDAVADLKKASMLFLNSNNSEKFVMSLYEIYNLRDRIKNDDVAYSILALYLMTMDKNLLKELSGISVKNPSLKRIINVLVNGSSYKGKDYEGFQEILGNVKGEDLKLLVEMINYIKH